jgi:hypothetical protein
LRHFPDEAGIEHDDAERPGEPDNALLPRQIQRHTRSRAKRPSEALTACSGAAVPARSDTTVVVQRLLIDDLNDQRDADAWVIGDNDLPPRQKC